MIILSVSLPACSFRPKVGPPWAQKMLTQGPEGTNLFKKGWRDGCETGISVTSNYFQRHFYSFKQDPELAKDKEYYTAWKSSFWYCSRYVMQYLRRHLI